ncbi:MAG: NAD(P)(+) transhydrogenase (Re/Si-specific) subunit beta [Planctomycetota bacterium]|nr:NAD(P)(+) transhydrogenase (Re/Si-specific) subunit beta [Planctomycetota bacterium]MCZ6811574.1 NAD(P)(+) transhydrogenase (Re/Si-specific) subunit beta [Planctomycetota bacterium]
MPAELRNVIYFVAAAMFIFGIKGLTHPRTAVRGNMLGAGGMLLAIVVTLIDKEILGWQWIILGLVLGSSIGGYLGVKIQMTAMPQLVALFNGFGGAASALVGGAVMHELISKGESITTQGAVAIAATGLIGAVTFSGSIVAFAKLQELISGKPITHLGLKAANTALTLLGLGLAVMVVMNPQAAWAYWLLVVVMLGLGVLLVLPIGGADMPVVITLLNSYSGLAACATGFVLNNIVLIIAGSLVGASGLILTRIMCVAMNRSLTNVLFGVMAEVGDAPSADEIYAGKVKATTPDEVAMLFDGARRVLIVPGYGMAVAQAQHAVRDLAGLLESRGIDVEFGIHPVAGRMPGHMNVLLAEADVPYDQLKEMDEVNSTMEQVDVVMVIGANDVVNPVARTDPSSPIAGMPIVDVDKARTVVVVKRSLSPGFAGIPNPLFAADNCLMMFGDGKKMVLELVGALKAG